MGQIGKSLIKVLTTVFFLTGVFSLQSFAAEQTRVLQTNSFEAFSSAVAEVIKDNGSSVQSNGSRDTSTYASKRLIVKSRGANLNLEDYGAETVIQGPSGYYVMQFATKQETEACLQKLQQNPQVEYAEPDGYDSVGEIEISDEIEAEELESAALSDSSASSYNSWGVEHIEADEYAEYLKQIGSNTGIEIAVVDSGVWNGHAMLQNCTIAGYDYVDNDDNPFNDGHGHGTHVAGTIVDCMSGLNVNILAVRVLADDGYGSHLNVGNGIRYAADHGARVINVSIGGGHSEYKDEAVQYAISKGAVVVVAAGNESTNVNFSCPGHMTEGITVSAVDEQNQQTWFTNYGNSIDVAAPGDYILSCGITGATSYVWMSGTSMAAPHVSAAAAMYRLRYPTAGPVKIQELVKRYCQDLGSTGWDQIYGNGILKMSLAIPEISVGKVTLGTATAVGSSQVQVTWNQVSNADGYRIYRKVPGGGWVRLKTISGSSTVSYTDSSVEPGKKYYYTVRAFQNSGTEVKLGDYDTTGLSVITGLDTPAVRSAQESSGGIKVTWNPVENAMGYRIYRRPTSSTTWTMVGRITKQESSSYVDTTAAEGVQYYYTVRATCSYDGVLKASAYQTPGVIGIIQNVEKTSLEKVTAIGSSQVEIRWQSVTGAQGYRVYRRVPGGGWIRLKTLAGNSVTSYTDNSVEPGTLYYYTVRAYRNSGTEIKLGDYDTTGLSVITGLDTPIVKSAESVSYNQIRITWEPVKNAMGYRVYRKEINGDTWKLIGRITKQQSSSLIDTTAVTGTQYYYTVRATCSYNGTLKASDYQNPGVIGQAVLGNTVITAIGNSGNGIKIVWNKVEGAAGYEIYRSTSSSTGFTKVTTITDNQTSSWTDTGVTSGRTYYYRLRAYCYADQQAVYSDFCSVRQITAQSTQSETYMEQYERLLRQCEQQFLYQSDDIAELLAEAQEELKIWEEEIETLNRAVEQEIGAARYLLYEASYYRWISQRDEKAVQRAQGYSGQEYQWRAAMSQIDSTQERCGWIIRTYLN